MSVGNPAALDAACGIVELDAVKLVHAGFIAESMPLVLKAEKTCCARRIGEAIPDIGREMGVKNVVDSRLDFIVQIPQGLEASRIFRFSLYVKAGTGRHLSSSKRNALESCMIMPDMRIILDNLKAKSTFHVPKERRVICRQVFLFS